MKRPNCSDKSGSPEDCAVAWCEFWIRDYERYWRTRKRALLGFQTVAIGFATATPVLIAAGSWEWLQAAFPAAAAAIWSAISIYHWQDNVARSAYTAEALSVELLRFQARDRSEQNETGRLESFLQRICELRMTEVGGWRSDFIKQDDIAKLREDVHRLIAGSSASPSLPSGE
jgi:hypothetical protein